MLNRFVSLFKQSPNGGLDDWADADSECLGSTGQNNAPRSFRPRGDSPTDEGQTNFAPAGEESRYLAMDQLPRPIEPVPPQNNGQLFRSALPNNGWDKASDLTGAQYAGKEPHSTRKKHRGFVPLPASETSPLIYLGANPPEQWRAQLDEEVRSLRVGRPADPSPDYDYGPQPIMRDIPATILKKFAPARVEPSVPSAHEAFEWLYTFYHRRKCRIVDPPKYGDLSETPLRSDLSADRVMEISDSWAERLATHLLFIAPWKTDDLRSFMHRVAHSATWDILPDEKDFLMRSLERGTPREGKRARHHGSAR